MKERVLHLNYSKEGTSIHIIGRKNSFMSINLLKNVLGYLPEEIKRELKGIDVFCFIGPEVLIWELGKFR